MKKENTVKSHREFDRIIHRGAKIKSDHYLVYGEKSEEEKTRIGIAVGKSNGEAHQRVRIKRQVRAMIAKRNDYSFSANLIIVVRPAFQEGEFDQNEAELNASLDQMKELLH